MDDNTRREKERKEQEKEERNNNRWRRIVILLRVRERKERKQKVRRLKEEQERERKEEDKRVDDAFLAHFLQLAVGDDDSADLTLIHVIEDAARRREQQGRNRERQFPGL